MNILTPPGVRCLRCNSPADVTLHSSGPSWPSNLLLDLCAYHATLALARGEAAIRPGEPGIPIVQSSISLGAVYGAGLGFLLTIGGFLLVWKVFG